MHRLLNRVLLASALAMVLADLGWVLFGHFTLDAGAYGLVALLVLPVAMAAFYYDHRRNESALSATLAVAAFLIVFPATMNLASYLTITLHGVRIDNALAAIDRALGFHWPAYMEFAADHPAFTQILGLAYMTVMPQTLVLLFVLGLRGRLEALYGLALALAIGAAITVAIWAVFPAVGAFTVYALPDATAKKLGLVLGFDYAHAIAQMFRDGPGTISPKELRGLIGFPSYHTLQAIVLVWYARREPYLRWAALALNLVVLPAIPIHGGHHLVDMFAGALVAATAILLSGRTVTWARKRARVESSRGYEYAEPRPAFTGSSRWGVAKR